MDGHGCGHEGGPLWLLVCGSASVGLLDEDELRAVFAVSRRNNPRLGVTGTLLHRGGNFLQVLEGEEGVVRDLHARVVSDPRHTGCRTYLDGPSPARMFPAWTGAARPGVAHAVEHRRALDAFVRGASELPARRARDVLTIVLAFLRVMR